MSVSLKIEASEYKARIAKLKATMAKNAIDVFLISDQGNFEYFSGYKSLFWASNARPFFMVVPKDGNDVFVVCSASEARAFSQTRTIPDGVVHKPYSGFMAECVKTIIDIAIPLKPKTIALDYGFEFFGIGSLALINEINIAIPGTNLIEGSEFIWPLRMIKSQTEIHQKKHALEVSTSAFAECLRDLSIGNTEIDFARSLTLKMIEKGADSVPWLPVRFGRKNLAYSLPPTDRRLEKDDFIWVDMGCIAAESLSDVNRIAKAGSVTADEQSIYSQVREMTISTLANMKPGMTGADVYEIFESLAKNSAIGLPSATASRIGHGSGTNLTEPPSIAPTSNEVLSEGMIIHVEPKYELESGVYQLEEVAVITNTGAEIITVKSSERFPVIGA